MLRHTAEESQPTAVLGAKREYDDQKPVSRENENGGQSGMTDQHETRPVTMPMPQDRIRIGKDMLVPISTDIALCPLVMGLDNAPGTLRIPAK